MCVIRKPLVIFLCLQILGLAFAQLEPQTDLKCETLSFRNGQLSCANPSKPSPGNGNNCDKPQEIGTIATYKCNPHFILQEITGTINRISDDIYSLKCNQHGKWNGLTRFKSLSCQEDCGKRLRNPKPLVIHGTATNATSWPWHATLYRRISPDKFSYICGGTIISRLSILTAAHCVSSPTGEKLSTDSTIVVLQAMSRNFSEIKSNKNSQILNIIKIFIPDSYDYKKQFQGDIAVLQLEREIEYSDYVTPACLPMDFSTDSIALSPGKLSDVVGFGVDETGQLAKELKHGVLEIKSRPECFVRLQQILTESQFCAGGQRGGMTVTVCNGDSGGGLFHPSVVQEKYNIHGIVSTSDPKSKRGLCENYAVFTRVYSFIFWIRDILEEIHSNGDFFIQLESNSSIPYIQQGTETWRKLFLPLPPELKNKVTEYQVSYSDINPELFLSSLEISRNVRLINLTEAKLHLQSEIVNRKVLLPYLEIVSIDLLPENFYVSDAREFPYPGFTKYYLDSFVFWEKEIEDEDKLSVDIAEKLPKLKTNFILQVNIFKAVRLDHVNGIITMAQIPFANEILKNLISLEEFKLQHLALSRSPLNVSTLMPKSQNLQHLILDQVIFEDRVESRYLANCKALLTFVFVSPDKANKTVEFYLNNFPKSLKHLSLTGANLVFNNDLDKLTNLETFYCNACFSDKDINVNFDQLPLIFPNLKTLIISLDKFSLNVESFLDKFAKLELVFVKDNEKSRKYIRQNERLIQTVIKDHIWGSDEFSHLDYLYNKKKNFWSSEADYNGLNRLSMAERVAMRSGHYRFNGGRQPLADGTLSPIVNPIEDVFTPLSPIIQKNLEIFEVSNADIRMRHIVDSLRFARGVKYLRIINVTVVDAGYIWEKVELPHLVEYILHVAGVPGYYTVDPHSILKILEGLFLNVFSINQGPNFQFRTNLLQSKVPIIRVITFLTCIAIDLDVEKGSLTTASISYTNDWLQNTNKEKPLKKLSYIFGLLNPHVVPDSIVDLNLNFVRAENGSLGVLLRRLINLKEMKLINIRIERSDNYKRWKIPQINIEDFPKSLTSFAIERARINFHSAPRNQISFENLKLAYFESCGFDPKFSQSFMTIFPRLEKLVIIGKSREAELILISGLNNPNVEWILTTTKLATGEEVKKLLNTTDLKLDSNDRTMHKLFIIKRVNNVWVEVESTQSQIKSQMLEIKGAVDFGTGPQCFAQTWHLIKKS